MKYARVLASVALAAILPCCTTNVGKGDQLTEVTVRVSVLPDGTQVTAPTVAAFSDGSLNASMSSDGRYVAFESTSNQYVEGDNNGFRDIIVKDRATGAVENITLLKISGVLMINGPRSADCFNPCISGNGRYVAFESTGDYVGGVKYNTLGFRNIWVYDRQTQTFVNATLNGNPGINADCTNAKLSDDGRFCVWQSAATNIMSQVGGGTTYAIQNYPAPPYAANQPATPQIYMTDLSMPAGDIITLVSHTLSTTSTGCNGGCSNAVISGDGSVVAFTTSGNDLMASGDTDFINDSYLRTIATDSIELLDLAINPATSMTEKANSGSNSVALSSDGRYALITTVSSNWGFASNLNILLRDRTLGVSTLVFPSSSGGISLSGDGQRAAFMANGGEITYCYIPTGDTRIISVNISGVQANNTCLIPWISEDGLWISYHTLADNLVPGDTNGQNDVFVRGPMGP